MKPRKRSPGPRHFALLATLALGAAPALAATPACEAAMRNYEELRSRSVMDEAGYANSAEAQSVQQLCHGQRGPAPAAAATGTLGTTPNVAPQAGGSQTQTPPSPLATTPPSPISTPASPLSTPAAPSLQPPANTALQPPANTTLQPAAGATVSGSGGQAATGSTGSTGATSSGGSASSGGGTGNPAAARLR